MQGLGRVSCWHFGIEVVSGLHLDRVRVRLLREENVQAVGPEILGATRAFLAGG